MSEQQTYWNGEPCSARKVRVSVGHALRPTWWCAGLEGTIRQAVEVTYGERVFFLDNEDGSGWWKVTSGKGSPGAYHAGLPNDSEVVDEDAPPCEE